MHIPDGYLSLQTSLPALGTMIPLWSVALKKLKNVLSYKQVPLLSLCAAFSFVIMMFNVPLGASSVHAVGAVFVAIIMGPWAACIAVSVALIIQALIFGDGGIIAIGANCFNMAFAMPFAGYFVYRLVAGNSDKLSKRSLIGTFLGSYAGLNVAAFLTAVEFGIQPLLFKTAGGQPLYGFYPLSVSVPAIMLEHLLIAGLIEGVVTMSAIAYLAKFNPQIFDRLAADNSTDVKESLFKRYKAFIIGIGIMIISSPIGLIASGTAWGEWDNEQVKDILGYVPAGLEKFSSFWKSLIPDYSFPGIGDNAVASLLAYIVSAVVGVSIIAAIMFLSRKAIVKKNNNE